MHQHPRLAACLGLLTLTLSATAARADTYPRQPGIDILNYAFGITLTDESDVIDGCVHQRSNHLVGAVRAVGRDANSIRQAC